MKIFNRLGELIEIAWTYLYQYVSKYVEATVGLSCKEIFFWGGGGGEREKIKGGYNETCSPCAHDFAHACCRVLSMLCSQEHDTSSAFESVFGVLVIRCGG